MTSFKPSNRFKKAWSLSSLTQYEDCPEKFKFIKLDKLSTGDKSPALEFGIMVHNKLEQYLLGEIKGVPPELKKFELELKKLLASGAVPEEELVMDKDWNAIEDGWWSKDAWWRGKTDVRLDNYIIDLKTGKHYPNHEDQAMLYSIAVFKYHPEYENIDVEFYDEHYPKGAYSDVHKKSFLRNTKEAKGKDSKKTSKKKTSKASGKKAAKA